MHGTNLMWGQSFIEEVDGGHLASKYPFFVYVWCTSNVAFVERLQKRAKNVKIMFFTNKSSKKIMWRSIFYFLTHCMFLKPL